jgi:glutamyl-tRNA synthetase
VQFDKLWFLQKHHAVKLVASAESPEALLPTMIQPILHILKESGCPWVTPGGMSPSEQQQRLFYLLKADASNYKIPQQFVDRHKYTFNAPSAETLRLAQSPVMELGHVKHRSTVHAAVDNVVPNATLVDIVERVSELLPSEDSPLSIEDRFKKLSAGFLKLVVDISRENAAAAGLPNDVETFAELKKSWAAVLHRYLRWALVADLPGPDSLKVMIVLGREESLRRLKLAGEVALEAQAKTLKR